MFRRRSLAETSRPVRVAQSVVSSTLILALTVLGMPVVPAAQEPVAENRWPRELETTAGGKIVVYQPQIDAWNDYKELHGLIAMSYASTANAAPEVGTARFTAQTETDLESGLVRAHSIVFDDVRFPALSETESEALATELKRHADGSELIVELDRLVADVERAQSAVRQQNINTEPPTIFFSDTPAILVQFDGEPVVSPIAENTEVKQVLNTNWDILQEPGTERWYLRVDSYWLSARNLSGPWSPRPAPDIFRELPDDDNWREVRSNIPGPFVGSQVPPVFTSETPAELILTDGLPALSPIPNSRLLMVTNTESDLFLSRDDGKFYFLVSGRWFSTDDLSLGQWTFATTDLPASFAEIPDDHAAAHVLASVPGTPQAEEAVILAQIPETAQVDRTGVEAPPVAYQGEPAFESIPGTSVARAVNTTSDILKVGDLYYLCFQGVWFRSTQPTGPWEVADEVPDPVYTIPADSPSHHVTYVTVEESNDDWVQFAVFAGYMGMMYAWGCCMVWGTGWYYPPYVYYGGFYPHYYPYPHSYGAGAWYNPATGRYGRGVSGYGPYGGFGYGSTYNPRTGTYARGGAAYGPYGAGRAVQAYNPRTGTSAAMRQGTNYYGAWSTAGVRQGNDWARTARVANADGARAAGVATSTGRRGFVATDGDNNLYAGRDGNVYRRTESGDWQQYGNGGWSNTSGERAGQAQQRVEQAGGRAGVADTARTRATQAGGRTGGADAARQRAGSSGRSGSTIGQLGRDASSRSRGTSRVQSRSRSGGFGGGGRARGRRR